MAENAEAYLRKVDGRYEFVHPAYDLKIRGPYVEWVLQAAADVIAQVEQTKTLGEIEELELLSEFDEDAQNGIQIDSLKYEGNNRFEVLPQCLISLGMADYKWVASKGASEPKKGFGERLHDMSLTRSQSWLVDQTA
ncbi:MAG: hypothetical protein AAFW47_04605 [Pseudomonadota bacterium]